MTVNILRLTRSEDRLSEDETSELPALEAPHAFGTASSACATMRISDARYIRIVKLFNSRVRKSALIHALGLSRTKHFRQGRSAPNVVASALVLY